MSLDAKIPDGPLAEKWDKHKFDLKLVNPANKRKFDVIVVGSGLAGASAAASLAELGYQVKCFCFQDSPRRAHSIAAQGGINAAKNYQNDGDSVQRLFYDTIKGEQQHLFRAHLTTVTDIMQISLWGKRDPDITFEFEPLWQMDGEKLARIRKSDADAAVELEAAGVVSALEIRQNLAKDPDSGFEGLDVNEPVPEPDDALVQGKDPLLAKVEGLTKPMGAIG